MLMRILSDNPGATFTQNIDKKFVDTVKDLIRYGKDPSVQQILRETLETFEREKKNDLNLQGLLEMWNKEKIKIEKALGRSVSRLAAQEAHHLTISLGCVQSARCRSSSSPSELLQQKSYTKSVSKSGRAGYTN